jgi:hypothetical protein
MSPIIATAGWSHFMDLGQVSVTILFIVKAFRAPPGLSTQFSMLNERTIKRQLATLPNILQTALNANPSNAGARTIEQERWSVNPAGSFVESFQGIESA